MDWLPEDREVEVLDEAECLRLLTTAAIGRVAFTEGALPAVQPVALPLLGDAEVLHAHAFPAARSLRPAAVLWWPSRWTTSTPPGAPAGT